MKHVMIPEQRIDFRNLVEKRRWGCLWQFESKQRETTIGPATVPVVGRDAVVSDQGGESYAVALSVGQYGDERLNGESPIGGLFSVGCDAGGLGLGTHQAVDAEINVSRLVLAYHQMCGQG